MCGRFVSTHTPDEIATYFSASFESSAEQLELPASFNVAPTEDIYAVVQTRTGEREVRPFQWGLVPSWAKDVKIGSSMINARAETISEKPAFKTIFKKYRCLIPMDGFYEWQAAGADAPVNAKGKPIKQPFYVHRVDDEPLAVAGLWSVWRDKNGPDDAPWLHTCTVITTQANDTMSAIHDRMPVILPESAWQQWLDRADDDIESLQAMLVPAPDSLLTMHKVSTEVNNARNKSDDLAEPIDE